MPWEKRDGGRVIKILFGNRWQYLGEGTSTERTTINLGQGTVKIIGEQQHGKQNARHKTKMIPTNPTFQTADHMIIMGDPLCF